MGGASWGGLGMVAPEKIWLWSIFTLAVAWVWRELEVGFLGYSQPSFVDTIAAAYIAWRLTNWCIEEEKEDSNDRR